MRWPCWATPASAETSSASAAAARPPAIDRIFCGNCRVTALSLFTVFPRWGTHSQPKRPSQSNIYGDYQLGGQSEAKNPIYCVEFGNNASKRPHLPTGRGTAIRFGQRGGTPAPRRRSDRGGRDKPAGERVGAAVGNLDPGQIARLQGAVGDMHGVQIVGLADHLSREATGLFEEHADGAPHHRVLNGALVVGDAGLQAVGGRFSR